MITVHHLNNSRSQRVLWMLEELGLEYEIEHYERDPETMLAPASLKAVHPLGKSPVITDGDVTVAESGAILEYIIETYGDGRLQPQPGTPQWRDYRFWMHYAEGSLMPFLVMKLVFRRIETSPAPFFIRPVIKGITSKVDSSFLGPNLSTHLQFVNDQLGDGPWFLGDELSAADVQMSFPVEAAMARASKSLNLPALKAFVERVHARPAYQAALERGGPLELLG